ncbi:MAG: lamin tail domain-containing protein, partial [Planctomycetales bacterium]|nr:lamin tail domain-containing protein [Planctomycetales bacterium]
MSRRSASRRPKNKPARKSRALRCEPLEQRLALTVVISEFLAENNSGLQDAAGHRHDWIELTNTGGSVEDVSGWYLTDDALNLTKWQIPATAATTSLAPGESLLVFASGNNGELGAVGDELHADFQLSQEPGYLGLVGA